MNVRLLGTVDVEVCGHRLALGPRKQRLVLAILALEANRMVPVARLVELVWPVNPPRTAAHAIRVCMSHLRAVLPTGAEVTLSTEGAGYALRADPTVIDVHRFRSLVAQARDAQAPQAQIELLDEALDLWRGPPLAGLAPPETYDQLCRGIEETRLVAIEDRHEARLRLGQHRELLDELTGLVHAHPHRERPVGQLMRALYGAGRQADALTVFRDFAAKLAADLGIDPGPELHELHLAMLRNDRRLTVPAPATRSTIEADPDTPWIVEAYRTPVTGGGRLLRELTRLADGARTTDGTGTTDGARVEAAAGRAAAGGDRDAQAPRGPLDAFTRAVDDFLDGPAGGTTGGTSAARLAAVALAGILGRSLAAGGRPDETRDVLRTLLSLLPADLAGLRVETVRLCAAVDRLLGDARASATVLAAELRRLDAYLPAGDRAAVLLAQDLAWSCLAGGVHGSGRYWADQAVGVARGLSDPALLAGSLAMSAASSLATACAGGVPARLAEAAALADGLSDEELAGRPETLLWLGTGESWAGRAAAATGHLTRGLALAHGSDGEYLRPYLHRELGRSYRASGRLARAAECLDAAAAAAAHLGSDDLRVRATSERHLVTAWTGDVSAALRRCAEVVANPGAAPRGAVDEASRMLAGVRLLAGDPAGCVRLLGPLAASADPLSRPGWYETLSEAEAALGDAPEALRWALLAARSAGPDLPVPQGLARLAYCHATLPVDPARVLRWACLAGTAFNRAGDLVHAGRAHLMAGRALIALGDPTGARARFGAAKQAFHAAGAALFVDQASRQQLNAGRRTRRGAAGTVVTRRGRATGGRANIRSGQSGSRPAGANHPGGRTRTSLPAPTSRSATSGAARPVTRGERRA